MSEDIRSRSSWDARYPDGDLTLTGPADEVFVHHSVTAQLSPDASVADEREQMRALESVGQSRFGTGISYNVVIFPSGRAYQGVSFHRRGTHTGGRNSTSRSICFAGNYETARPTAAALATAAAIYAEGKGHLWILSAPLRGHRDVSQTACPGRHLYAQIPAIRAGRTITQEDEMSDKAEKQIAEIHERLGGRVMADGTKHGLLHDTAHEWELKILRRIEARQIAREVVPVDIDVDAVDVADALVERLPKPLAQAVADVLHTRLAK